MELVRDVLDEQIVDTTGRKVGKVDGIVLQLRRDQPPRVVAIEVGGGSAAARMPRLFRGLVQALARRLAPHPDAPYRIPWSKVHCGAIDIRLDVDASRTTLVEGEDAAARIVARLPGAGAA